MCEQIIMEFSQLFELHFKIKKNVWINPISAGVSDQRLVPGWESLGSRSYFQLIWTPFWTCGTIIEQLIVKGIHQWSCREKKIEGTLKIDRVIAIFVGEKNFSIFFRNSKFELKMAKAQ